MRFNVISLACALAAPAMAAEVGFFQGQQGAPLQEFDGPPQAQPATQTPAVTPAPAITPVAAAVSSPAVIPSVNNQVHVSSQAQSSKAGATSDKTTPTTKAAAQTPTTAAKATAAPTSAGGSSGSGGVAPKGGQILYIVNKYGSELAIATGNSGGPAASGGSPSLPNGATATITLQSGWAGRFAINPTGVPAYEQDGTKIEGALTSQGFWDISLVDGYTVPITCTCDGDSTPFIGCNVDLFKQSAKCPSPSGSGLCLNPARSKNNGPADPWFSVCKDAAYTYPDNDIATQTCSKESLTCCVGTSCAAGKNQGKRSINPVYARWAFPRSAFNEEN